MLWLKVVVIFAVLFSLVWAYKHYQQRHHSLTPVENFESREKYMLKRNQDVYDDFYSVVYHDIMVPPGRVQQEVDLIEKTTQPSKEVSTILDLGSGTGEVMEEWSKRGYKQVYGIEASQQMIEACHHEKKDHIVAADFMKRSSFETNTFSHILCLNKTIYEVDNKLGFFKNCYAWLKPGGYLVLHAFEMPRQNTSKPLTGGFSQGWKYEASLEPMKDDSKSFVLLEQMTHPITNQVRIHERQVHYKELGDLINDAMYTGFIVAGKAATVSPCPWSPKEYLYFLQK